MALKLYLFEPKAMYAGGALGVAAESLEQATAIANSDTLRHISESYCIESREWEVCQTPHILGVSISGKPRIIFSHTYEE